MHRERRDREHRDRDRDLGGSGDPVEASASGEVTVVDLPSTGGTLGLYLPFGLGILTLGLLALWWARRRTLHSEA